MATTTTDTSEAGRKSSPKKPVYFCIDVEASGPVPGLYNMVSLGCCVVTDDPREAGPELGAELYLELKLVFPGVDPEAMAIHGLDLETLQKDGLDPTAAMERLAAFAAEHTPADHRAVFVGHNAPFDWMMVCYYYCFTGVNNPFGYSAICTKALAMGLFGLPWSETNKEVLPGLLGIAPEDKSVKHRADYDARFQAEIFAGLLRQHREVAAGRSS